MARIPDNEITRIKSDISLQRLVESRGIKLKRHGKDLLGLCPFHDDHNPSLVITPSENLWHCLGACNSGGSVIDWVMKAEGVSFRHAVELLQNDVSSLAANNPVVKKSTTTKLASPLSEDVDKQTALQQVINFYHHTLKQSSEAQAYLKQRGLDHSELIEHFKLGYANRTLGLHLPQKNRVAGAKLRGQLQDIGIYRDSGHEHFNGALVVPVINDNQVLEVYGRKLQGNRLRKGTIQHLYLPGAHEGVFNLDALRASDEIILCESLIDAMTFWVNGFRNVTSSYGTNGFTDDHLAAFKQHKIQRVLIAYDRDEAGNKAANELAKKLITESIDCYRINFPKGMDANEYANQVTPAGKSLGLAIRKAEWLGKGKASTITTAATLNESLPAIEEIETVSAENAEEATQNELSSLAASLPPATEASPLPDLPKADLDAQINDHEIKIQLDKCLYRIRGLQKNLSYEQLKINLLVSISEHVYVDQLDLYNARQRQAFIKQASVELGIDAAILKTDLGQLLLKLESLQEQNIKKELSPKEDKTKSLSNEAYQSALDLLKDKNLLQRILDDFTCCGVVGEETNILVGYLSCVSRKLNKPLAIMVQSSSAAGKSSLMDAVLAMMPEEDKTQYSAMTGQSLFYMGESDLKNKILAIAEEEGASNASYALKLLQSEGEVTIASTSKDETTGNMVTKSYKVEGPVMLFLTTTAIDIDEELLNRCLVLTVNESTEQTHAIHDIQRQQQTLEGLLADNNKTYLTELHQNAQRLLQPLRVVNPYAKQLTFLSDKTRTRRDHMKYLQLINSITLLHQYQRETKTVTHRGELLKYIEVTLEDIATANKLAHDVLGRSLDELPPQTRKLLEHIHHLVDKECCDNTIKKTDYRFTRKDIRHFIGWTDFQVKTHIRKLEDMEYVLVHRGRRGQSFIYELLYNGEGQNEAPFLMGLIDVAQLKHHYDTNKVHQKANKKPPGSPQSAPKEHRGCMDENATIIALNADNETSEIKKILRDKNNRASYRSYRLPVEA
jgi:DNA primase catalytic core